MRRCSGPCSRMRLPSPLPHVGDAVQQRQLVLDLSRFASRSTMPPNTGATSPGCATSRAISTSRSPTCAPGWRAASACRGRRSTGRDASIAAFVSRRSAQERLLQAVRDDAARPCRRPSSGASRRGRSGDRRRRSCRPIASCSTSIANEYLPKARTTISAHDLPDGDAFYRAQIREYTTTDLTPEEIHQLGLKRGRADRRRDAPDDARERASRARFAEFLQVPARPTRNSTPRRRTS